MKNVLKYGFFLLCFIFISQQLNAQNRKSTKKINNSIIFDLYMNYELTEKNGNLSTIIDFFPSTDFKEYKKVTIDSNVGGEKGICSFYYNDKGAINKVTYQINRKIYTYEFIYDGKYISYIKIAGKKKIEFVYDRYKKIKTIKRIMKGAEFEFNFDYTKSKKKFDIELVVIQGVKRRPSSRKYYATLNSDYKLKEYYIDVFSSKDLEYTKSGDLLNSSFTTVNEDNNKAEWKYISVDDEKNWTERSFNKILFKRTIKY